MAEQKPHNTLQLGTSTQKVVKFIMPDTWTLKNTLNNVWVSEDKLRHTGQKNTSYCKLWDTLKLH